MSSGGDGGGGGEGGGDGGDGGGGGSRHVVNVNSPRRHDVSPDAVNPSSHVGWHDDPLANELGQSPRVPFVSVAGTSHDSASHVPWVRLPRWHTLIAEEPAAL